MENFKPQLRLRIGFTGTQVGMTEVQKKEFYKKLVEYGATELHHGDCIGADADAHNIASSVGIKIVMHPPTDESKRAFCQFVEEVREPKPYLQRNHEIVDETDMLIATPKSTVEELRSGTWATIRYAHKKKPKKIIEILYP